MKEFGFKKWIDFRSFVDNDRQIMPIYWRGQMNPSWALASTFEREILSLNGGWKEGASNIYPYDGRYTRNGKLTWEDGFYQSMRDRYLKEFIKAASGLRGPNPAELEPDQWWALGRHFGLVTPLLDWTEKPYIASFFALWDLFNTMKDLRRGFKFQGKDVAIYRLFHNENLEGNGLRVLTPLVEELGHLQSQRSVFTWLDSEIYFELQGFLDNTGKGDLLTKIILSDQVVFDGLRDLAAHGIDHRLLFPDLTGAALFANTRWDIF